MEKESNQEVTFFKHHLSLFKKASELSILCGAPVAVIVSSSGNKAFSFGSPSVNAVVDQFLTQNQSLEESDQIIEAERNTAMMELSQRLNHLENLLEVEKQRGQALDQMRIARQGEFWWEESIDKMNMEQLEQMKTHLEDLKDRAIKQVEKLRQEQAAGPFNTSMAGSSSPSDGDDVPSVVVGGANDDPQSLLGGRDFSGAPFDIRASGSAPPIVP